MNSKTNNILPETTLKHQCDSCPFLPGGLKLGTDKMTQIESYLLSGTNHFCHSDKTNKTICQGGRKYQLEMWHKMGIIEAPTNEALRIAMAKAGVSPKGHI